MHPIPIWCVLVALATACASTQPTLPAHTAADSAGVRTWTFAHPVADLLTDTTDNQVVVRMNVAQDAYLWQWMDGMNGEPGWQIRYSEARHRNWVRYEDKLYRADQTNPMLLDLRTRERLVAPKLMQTLYDPVHNLFVGFEEGLVTNGVVAYDADTGERKWSSRYFSTNLTPLIRLDPDTWVFMTSKMHVLDPRDGSGWRKDVNLPVQSSFRVNVPASVTMSVMDTAMLLTTGAMTMGVSLWVMFEYRSSLKLPYVRLGDYFYMLGDGALQAVHLDDGSFYGNMNISAIGDMPASLELVDGDLLVVAGPVGKDPEITPFVARYRYDMTGSPWHRSIPGLLDHAAGNSTITVLTRDSVLLVDAATGLSRRNYLLETPATGVYQRIRSDIRHKEGDHILVLETDTEDQVALDLNSGETEMLAPGDAWGPESRNPDVLTDGISWRVGPLVVPKADSYFRSADHHWFVYGNRVVSYPVGSP